jgi:hypothetical protein
MGRDLLFRLDFADANHSLPALTTESSLIRLRRLRDLRS